MDLALEDLVKAAKVPIKRIRYKGTPLIGEDFELLVYPCEAIFSEKLQIAINRGAQNTRMKDYYDLYKLCSSDLNSKRLVENIQKTFAHRNTKLPEKIIFDAVTIKKLQEMWSRYLSKEKLKDAPTEISDIVEKVNNLLRGLVK